MVKEIGCRLVGEVVVPSPHQGCVRISVFVAVPLSGAKTVCSIPTAYVHMDGYKIKT
jgi:hypothetical protein